MVLIPSQKWTYIQENWPKSWVSMAKQSVQGLWEEYYKPIIEPMLISDLQPDSSNSSFAQWAKQKRKKPMYEDEYLRYCQLPTTPECDARGWWMEPA
jgi:hypothetical protein